MELLLKKNKVLKVPALSAISHPIILTIQQINRLLQSPPPRLPDSSTWHLQRTTNNDRSLRFNLMV